MTEFYFPLLGGILIGLAVTLMLWLNGRVTGISGIINSAMSDFTDSGWRWSFLAGLLVGGFVLHLVSPQVFVSTTGRTLQEIGLAGFLVGFGTVLGGGCTSGHGVCGVSRFSWRSILATIVFVASGIIFATFLKDYVNL